MLFGRSVRILAVLLTTVTVMSTGLALAATGTDITMTKRAKTSQTYRQTIVLKDWQASPHGKQISWRESHDVCRAVSSDGKFRGKWQVTASLWRQYGGAKFARMANRATCLEQDKVARRIWIDQWWWPWGG